MAVARTLSAHRGNNLHQNPGGNADFLKQLVIGQIDFPGAYFCHPVRRLYFMILSSDMGTNLKPQTGLVSRLIVSIRSSYLLSSGMIKSMSAKLGIDPGSSPQVVQVLA
jgi:hypothetical protein